jgi:hypothetical protein
LRLEDLPPGRDIGLRTGAARHTQKQQPSPHGP